MLAEKMIPWLWLRLVVVVGFGVFVTFKGMYILTAIAALLAVLTAYQLRSAYISKRSRGGSA